MEDAKQMAIDFNEGVFMNNAKNKLEWTTNDVANTDKSHSNKCDRSHDTSYIQQVT